MLLIKIVGYIAGICLLVSPLLFALISLYIRQKKRNVRSTDNEKIIIQLSVFYTICVIIMTLIILGKTPDSVPFPLIPSCVLPFLIGLVLCLETVERNKRSLKENGVRLSQKWGDENGYTRTSPSENLNRIIFLNEQFRDGYYGDIISEIESVSSSQKEQWVYKCKLSGNVSDLPYTTYMHQRMDSALAPHLVRSGKKVIEWGEREVDKDVFRTDTRVVSEKTDGTWQKSRRTYIQEMLTNLRGVDYVFRTHEGWGDHAETKARVFGYARTWTLEIKSKIPPLKMLPFLDEQICLMYEIARELEDSTDLMEKQLQCH